MPDPEIDQNSLSDLQDELRYLLNRWDPIGIYDESLDSLPMSTTASSGRF